MIKARTAESWKVLTGIGHFVAREIDPQLAMTDPARYRKLARLKTEIILRGYYSYFRELTSGDNA